MAANTNLGSTLQSRVTMTSGGRHSQHRGVGTCTSVSDVQLTYTSIYVISETLYHRDDALPYTEG